MEKGNVIDFTCYCETRSEMYAEPTEGGVISHELEEAIEQLIQRLKDANPIQHTR